MDSLDIAQILKTDRYTKHYFRGVFPSDRLPRQYLPRPSALVVNTDPSTKPGQHWIAIYVTRNGVGEYFDSYGLPPVLPALSGFLTRNASAVHYNPYRLQGPLTAVCGQYCLFFLLHRCRDISMNKILHFFTEDTSDNDFLVNDFVSGHFPNSNTRVYDIPFVTRQIARAFTLR